MSRFISPTVLHSGHGIIRNSKRRRTKNRIEPDKSHNKTELKGCIRRFNMLYQNAVLKLAVQYGYIVSLCSKIENRDMIWSI